MINNVVLTGRLTKEVDLRYTGTGTAVASFTLAVNRQFKSQSGERETDFINCVMWRKAAENFTNFARKGSLVGIQGRIQTRNYEGNDGKRVYVTEVVADNFTLLESQNKDGQRTNDGERVSNQGNSHNRTQASNNGFNDYNSNEDPFLRSGKSIDISDDDMPF